MVRAEGSEPRPIVRRKWLCRRCTGHYQTLVGDVFRVAPLTLVHDDEEERRDEPVLGLVPPGEEVGVGSKQVADGDTGMSAQRFETAIPPGAHRGDAHGWSHAVGTHVVARWQALLCQNR